MLGSGLYQVLQPLFAGFGRPSGPAPKTEADLTRDQQAQAAASVLQELNRKATAKYLKYAKDYKPPVPAPMAEPIVQLKAESKADVDDDDDDNVWAKPIVELKAESKADVDDNVWADAAHPAMEPLV
ncbi:hypothetical protein H4R19_005870 [Coemansia spiralis]|nr:hypothetical protein H4R19_005870 [Coemansia spiralis]